MCSCPEGGACATSLACGFVGAATLCGMWAAAATLLLGDAHGDGDMVAGAFAEMLGVAAGFIAGLMLGRLLDRADGWADRVFLLTAGGYVVLGVFCLWSVYALGYSSAPEWPPHAAKWIGLLAPLPLWVLMFLRARSRSPWAGQGPRKQGGPTGSGARG